MLLLFPGEEDSQGRFVSRPFHVEGSEIGDYSELEIRPISSLAGFPEGSAEATLLGGGQRYLGSLAGTSIAMELLAISDGLSVADAGTGAVLSGVGDRFLLGAGDSFGPLTPRFFTDTSAAVGSTFSATCRLVDLNGLVPESGLFTYRFRAVPEPTAVESLGVGLGGLGLFAARRRRARRATACEAAAV